MAEMHTKLETLGLAQYATILHENGFEDWDTVLDITEDDMNSMGFKRGHRRILQKEIASARGFKSSPTMEGLRLSSSTPGVTAVVTTLESFEKRTKRRYRWHPRADPNAPKKPKTAYVNFADHLRSDPSIASLSFVDIAREVGRRWQTLDPTIKQDWENRAAQVMQAYEDQMDAYRTTKQYQDYQNYLETFKKAPGKSARQKIKSRPNPSMTSPRRSESSGADRSPSASIDSPTLSSIEDSLREDCSLSLGTAIAELAKLRVEYAKYEPFSATDLPSESLCRHAMSTLIDGTVAIFYVVSPSEAEALFHRIYRLPGSADPSSLIELCVLTAVGAHFAGSSIPKTLHRRLLATVCSHMEGLAITDSMYLRLMRMLLCLAICSIEEKYLGARSFLSAALAIARLKHPFMIQDGSREDWRKIYRTLVFMECWLSQTLGYNARNLDAHVRSAVEPVLNDGSIENAIQWQAVRIAIIANEISAVIRQQNPVSPEVIRYLAGQLDLWQRELPHEMQLVTLLSANAASTGQNIERATLLVHIFYLSAVILLYGQPLIAAEDAGRDADTPEVLHYRSTCLVAGEQISRLMSIVNGNQTWTARSWLLIYCAFSASNVLMLGAAQALRNRSTNDHDRLVSLSRAGLNTLEACAQNEPVAARYLDMIAPIYESLKRLRESPHVNFKRRKSEHKISIKDLLASDNAGPTSSSGLERWSTIDDEVPGLIRQVTELLKDPFGRAQQDSVPGDPYPSPPSNADLLFWFRV